MKRYALFLLPVLLMAALAPVASSPSTVSAIAGAAFTTVNVALDGPGHCRNGNPAINCNIYTGKQYVWLNGGPKANKLGPDGKYFFAVLAPGGQPAPNDGGAKNLSDDYDKYTNRTFTVKNGRVSAYTGTHKFDRGLIRLLPYADTPNPGGVYTLAVCSLAKGYPVKASACKYDQFKVKCVPQVVNADFAVLGDGAPVGGWDTVEPGLDIQSDNAPSELKVILEGSNDPIAYGAGVNEATQNGGVDKVRGGFTDTYAVGHKQAHHYFFTFTQPISKFSLRMLDFGDFNPQKATNHLVTVKAYDTTSRSSSRVAVDWDKLEYTSDDGIGPTSSNLYGNLQISGDALMAASLPPQQPGLWTWSVSGQGIMEVELEQGVGFDPYSGFDLLSYTVSCP